MIDIVPAHLETVKGILRSHVPECEVRAYGSRVTGAAKSYSDLDIAVKGTKTLDTSRLNRLVEAFQDSDLPFRVDVLDWNGISESFREVIDKRYEVIQGDSA
jgi:type I restriction enzyme S subunit